MSINNLDVYLYGMTVLSTIHLLDGRYPEADTYQEIKETHIIPGGETGNSALILANLGLKVKMDGPFLGTKTKEGILDFYRKFDIDCSGLVFDPSYDGIQDLVLVGENSRTVFGKFGSFFRCPKRWSQPSREAIQSAKIVAVDPFFGEESIMVAKYSVVAGKMYITIDCEPESELARNAAAVVISNEFIKNQFSKSDLQSLFRKYTDNTNALVIFTFGGREILYGRTGGNINLFTPYQVLVKSTLGAGDTFRAGVVYGILQGWDDLKIVKFAAATAALVCARFPMAYNPPDLKEIMQLIK